MGETFSKSDWAKMIFGLILGLAAVVCVVGGLLLQPFGLLYAIWRDTMVGVKWLLTGWVAILTGLYLKAVFEEVENEVNE